MVKSFYEFISERNYKLEYQNYQGRPEQIKRRSSRNKARRAMGDKSVSGMDVGHKDNNPLNNDTKNLRNEHPSKNRREPRLRENSLETFIERVEKGGETFSGFSKPKSTPNHPKKSHAVVVKDGSKEKLIRFGQKGAKGSPDGSKRNKAFKARHAKNISKGKTSAAYWANKVKW